MQLIKAADLFAGCGGTSWGVSRGAHRMGSKLSLVAVNHNQTALKTHAANLPDAIHLRDSLFDLDPMVAVPGGKLDYLHASPECTNHSHGKGDKPRDDKSRSTADCVVKWAKALKPNVITVENVVAFLEWGPLDDDMLPIKSRKGELFRRWVLDLEAEGYKVEWRKLNAADFGDPTSRERLIIQAVRVDSRLRICWPDPLYGPGRKRPHRCVAEIMNLDDIGTSIFTRVKPLVKNTLLRIEAGLKKQGIPPFVVRFMEDGVMPYELDLTETPKGFLAIIRGTTQQQIDNCATPLHLPLPVVTTSGGHHRLVQPFLTCRRGTSESHINASPIDMKDPIRAVATRPHFDVTQSFVLGQQSGAVARDVSKPLPTVATAGKIRWFKGIVPEGIDPRLPVIKFAGEPRNLDIVSRMLHPVELARGSGFPRGYKFFGNKTEVNRQIGNAVPPGLSEAVFLAVMRQNSDVSTMLEPLPGWTLWD